MVTKTIIKLQEFWYYDHSKFEGTSDTWSLLNQINMVSLLLKNYNVWNIERLTSLNST
jgi:hypothetical protein